MSSEGMDAEQIKNLVLDFYANADASAPVSWFLPLIADDFYMWFAPDCELRGPEGFVEFYRNLTGNLFDRLHVVRDIDVRIGEGKADVTFIIHLTAKRWSAPMPKALHTENEAHFHWVMEMSLKTNAPVITSYRLTAVSFPEGSIIVEANETFMDRRFKFGPWSFP